MFLPRSVFKHILIGMAKNGQVFKLVFECGIRGQIVPLQRSSEEFHKSIAQDAIDAQREGTDREHRETVEATSECTDVVLCSVGCQVIPMKWMRTLNAGKHG